MKYGMREVSILLMSAMVSLLAGTTWAVTDESVAAHSGDKVETRGPNPDQVAAINKKIKPGASTRPTH